MGRAKDITVKPVAARDANRVIKALHYSGKVCQNSQVHLGVFLDGKCGGALQFGPSLDKRKLQGLVARTLWNEFIELNRLAFADWLPRNSESRALAYAMRWLRKTYPWLKWVVSFADATQCGDGAIYRASGFVLTAIKKNTDLWQISDGTISHAQSIKQIHFPGQRGEFQRAAPDFMQTTRGKVSPLEFLRAKGKTRVILNGFQLRYIYFLDPAARDCLTVPIVPFGEIERRGAGMYRGKPISRAGSDTKDTPGDQPGKGGSTPTPALQTYRK